MNNPIEFELKVLEVDPDALIKKIKSLGGDFLGEYLFRRYVFETIPSHEGRWLRLRTNGKIATLTVKQIDAYTVDGTSEWETKVGDFDDTLLILKKAGLNPKGYQENKRIEFKLKDTLLAIDTWPQIPTYLEIEGPNEVSVKKCANLLGYKDSNLTADNTQKVYAKYGIDIKSNPNLHFPA